MLFDACAPALRPQHQRNHVVSLLGARQDGTLILSRNEGTRTLEVACKLHTFLSGDIVLIEPRVLCLGSTQITTLVKYGRITSERMLGNEAYMITLDILQQPGVIKFTRFAGGRRKLATSVIKWSIVNYYDMCISFNSIYFCFKK